jgi:hypothetical protein
MNIDLREVKYVVALSLQGIIAFIKFRIFGSVHRHQTKAARLPVVWAIAAYSCDTTSVLGRYCVVTGGDVWGCDEHAFIGASVDSKRRSISEISCPQIPHT